MNKSDRKYVWVAVKNKMAKDMNRQPWYYIRRYAVERETDKCVVLMNKKQFPKERCFDSEEECKASVGDMWKRRRWGDWE